MDENKPKILVVDDETELLEIIVSYLEMEGYEVDQAESVSEALDKVTLDIPDLIISDVSLPDKSGFEFFETIRNNHVLQHVPFVFLSGHTDAAHIMKGKELGSDDYLTKPFAPNLLLSTIRGKLKRRQQLRESMTNEFQQLRQQLLHVFSHEMRTPLTTIIGATEFLTNGQENLSNDEFTGFLTMLKQGSKRLNSMIEDFLLVAKIDTGEIQKEIRKLDNNVSMDTLLSRLIGNYEEIINSKQIRFAISVPAESIHLIVHSPHLDNMICRLIDNAVKFTPHEGDIAITGTDEKTIFALEVRNTGETIPAEQMGKLFHKFSQINRERTEQQGSGLGLYIAKRLAEANNCTLTCHSNSSDGTAFTLRIPKRRTA